MPTYMESEIPTVISSNGSNGNGFFGNDGIWAILLLALLGFGGRGWGAGGYGSGGGSSEFVGYELGKVATQADVASGFSTSSIISGINDIKLGQSQMQNFINQGFAGLNSTIMSGFHGVDNAVCTLGYQTQAGFNSLSHQISDCCCQVSRAIDGVNYNMAKNTCDIIQANTANTQRVIDFLTNEKIEALRAENTALKGRISNDAQSAYLIDKLGVKSPVSAYIVPNPNCCYNPCGCGNTTAIQ